MKNQLWINEKLSSESSSSEGSFSSCREQIDTNYSVTFSDNCSSSLNRKFSELSVKSNSKFRWVEKYSKNVVVDIVQTDFQSMRVLIHYGNYKLPAKVILTKIREELFFPDQCISEGVFGKVYSVDYQNLEYAIKVVKVQSDYLQSSTLDFYKQFFLCSLADDLGVGPSVCSLFGYDMVFFQNLAMFAMQKCEKKKSYKISLLKKQLLQELEILHTNNIVHLDIKPSNISFSKKRQRHVFIDFGLSKIIRQSVGEKTSSKFIGTLNYCSQEMKKCYILQQESLIDLYANDRFALQKSLNQINFIYEKKLSLQSKEEFNEEMLQNYKYKKQLFKKIVVTMNLKSEIFDGNYDGALKLLDECAQIPQTCFCILDNMKVGSNRPGSKEFKQKFIAIKLKMFDSKQKRNSIDLKISQLLNDENRRSVFLQMIPINQILKTNKEQFSQCISYPEWMTKIFFIFDPFQEEKRYKFKERNTLRNMIVEKIYELAPQNEKNTKYPNYICFKTEYSLTFFYQQMKKNRSGKFLVSLRFLMIATMSKLNCETIKNIQNQILYFIENQGEKILRIIEFFLFWTIDNAGFHFEHEHLFKHSKKILQNIELDSSLYIKKLKKVLKQVIYEQDFFDLSMGSCDQQTQTCKQLDELQQMSDSKIEKTIIFQIKSFYYFLIHQKEFGGLPQVPNTLQFYIYYRYFKFLSSFNIAQANKYKDLTLTFTNFFEQFRRNNNDPLFFRKFQNFHAVTEVMGLKQPLIGSYIDCIHEKSENISRFAEFYFQQMQQVQKHNNLEQRQLFKYLCLSQSLISITKNRIFEEYIANKKIEMLGPVLSKIKQKCSWLIQKCQSVHVSALKVKSLSLQILLKNSENQRTAIIDRFSQCLQQRQFNDGFISIVSAITIFTNMKNEAFFLLQINRQLVDLFQDYFDRLMKNNIFIFASYKHVLHSLFQIKIKKEKFQDCLQLILFLIEKCNEGQNTLKPKISLILVTIYSKFLSQFPTQFLYEKFHKIYVLDNKCLDLEFLCFYLSLQVSKFLTVCWRKKIFFRMLMLIEKMAPFYQQMIYPRMYAIAMDLNIQKNMKQKGQYFRKLANCSTEFHQLFSNFLRLKLQKVKSKRNLQTFPAVYWLSTKIHQIEELPI